MSIREEGVGIGERKSVHGECNGVGELKCTFSMDRGACSGRRGGIGESWCLRWFVGWMVVGGDVACGR